MGACDHVGPSKWYTCWVKERWKMFEGAEGNELLNFLLGLKADCCPISQDT